MNIVKSLHASLLHRCYSHQEKHYFVVSVLWGFDLLTGEPVLEQDLWTAVGDNIGKGQLFDAGMPKANGELLVSGSCCAPTGKKINAGKVSVSLGEIAKELHVFGDRHWIKGMGVGWGVSEPEYFEEMPISYLNAFGGKDYKPNPVGKGIDEVPGDTGPVVPLPNVEYPKQIIGSPNDKPDPASLNSTDMMCEQRISYAGTYDQKYIETRMPGFPDDLDYHYFNDAARDQWNTTFFNGDESYEIRNMNPDHALLQGRLPGVRGRAFVNHLQDGKVEFKEINTKLDTVWFLPGARLGVVVHRGLIEVAEDDASDVQAVMVANENQSDNKRSVEHYQNEMMLRTDKEEAFKYLMYTAPLIPEGVICAFESMNDSGDYPLENLSTESMSRYSEAQKLEAEKQMQEEFDNANQQMKESGFSQDQIDEFNKKVQDAKDKGSEGSPEAQKINEIMEKVMPGLSSNPDKLDYTKLNLKALDELHEYMEAMKQDKTAENRQRLQELLDKLRNDSNGPENEQAAQQIETLLKEMDLPPLLPRVDVEDVLARMAEQREEMERELHKMQSMGLPQEDLDKYRASVDFDAMEKDFRENIRQFNETYRESAHHLEQARSPHEGREPEIRDKLLSAFNAGQDTSLGDYAFIDLSGQDLKGINLSDSYLEYADFTDATIRDADFSNAILSHAKFDNTVFDNVNFTGANLGAAHFKGAKVLNSDFTDGVLGKARFDASEFRQCKMADKLDMLFEASFDNAGFIDCDMRKNAFVDTEFKVCDFSQSDLSESSMLNPVMQNTVFSGAVLNGVNIVTANADGCKFDKATMNNVRFVAGSSLQGADFTGAVVREANLRESNCQNAVFDESDLEKTDFGGADLRNASFRKASAITSQFNNANLEHAVLDSANLFEGSMYKARISSASFFNSNLYSVNFMGCTHGSTDFTGADLHKTIFKDWRP